MDCYPVLNIMYVYTHTLRRSGSLARWVRRVLPSSPPNERAHQNARISFHNIRRKNIVRSGAKETESARCRIWVERLCICVCVCMVHICAVHAHTCIVCATMTTFGFGVLYVRWRWTNRGVHFPAGVYSIKCIAKYWLTRGWHTNTHHHRFMVLYQ